MTPSLRLFDILLFILILAGSSGYPTLSSFKTMLVPPPLLKRAADMVQRMMPSSLQEIVVVGDLKKIIEDGPIPVNERCFMINGWRWHTASVIRDLERFKLVVQEIKKKKKESSGFTMISTSELNSKDAMDNSNLSNMRVFGCYNFVVGFNWKALMRVESEIFFPWLQKLLPQSAISLMTDIIRQHSTINILSTKMEQQCNLLMTTQRQWQDQNKNFNQEEEVQSALASYRKLEDLILEMQSCALRIQGVQESIFVPYIAAFVPKKEQEVFNRMVIQRLGLLDSQVHLVSMFDAIRDKPVELKFFEEQIPRVARLVLPVWRTRLYQPRARYLDLTTLSK